MSESRQKLPRICAVSPVEEALVKEEEYRLLQVPGASDGEARRTAPRGEGQNSTAVVRRSMSTHGLLLQKGSVLREHRGQSLCEGLAA